MSEVNLNQIRQVEKESDKILDEAEEKMEQIIKNAKEEAENLKSKARKDGKTEAEEIRSKVEEETEKEIANLEKGAVSRKEQLRDAKKNNLDKAISAVVDQVTNF